MWGPLQGDGLCRHRRLVWCASLGRGLNLPFPTLLAFLAAGTEVLGCICIALGLFTRIMAIPTIFLMSVASAMVHWKHGWDAIATGSMEATVRLNGFIEWLAANFPGRYNYITELGTP